MSRHWDDDPEARRGHAGADRHHVHHHARRRRRATRRPLTREERAYLEARRRANARMGFLFHAIPYACTVLFLLFLSRTAALAVALFWGMGVACHYLAAIGGGDLRRRWIEKEVDRQLRSSVSQERQAIGGAHARSLEALSASIAHEIRNPITAAKSLVQQMGEDTASAENVEYAKVALEELDRVERSISHLLRFARDEEVQFSETRLSDVVEAALETFRDRIEQRGVAVHRELDDAARIQGDPEKLRRVAINLFGNALDSLESARIDAPRIEVQMGENLAGDEVWLRIRDNGPGIDPDALHKIFSPFYTSKETGTGLGLALSKKVVDAHGGTIEVDSTPGGGAAFVLTFPKRRASSGGAAS
ncbi:MAG: HAMP domain-containing histidine kinase [Deltaproteobacteria bacterium]|nr:MAG: HAMP domain-containing histidine kinase [Deltaproteobacteria bacterium]